jgi:hypothetical protein
VTLSEPLLVEGLRIGECVDVYFDCEQGEFTLLSNLVVMQGASAPLLAIAAPTLPQSLGAWAPTVDPGAACPTDECPNNTALALQFVRATFREGEGGSARIVIGDDEIGMDVFVKNAHYDPTTCERRLAWAARPE